MSNLWDVLEERGFIQQATDATAIRELLGRESVTCYTGFDPTADSLHAGSLIPLMALAHAQRCGHRPIAIIGGGTALVGDPSGKTEMRKMLAREQIQAHAEKIQAQIGRYLDFQGGAALALNNADWLLPLNYIDFLREIGRHFSVNRMLTLEAYRLRLESEAGLSFLEFNYQLLQAYDFLVLFRNHRCLLQMGGNDQWGNIVAGTDLIRRVEGATAYGLTYPLLETATGEKMGKTARGTVWLDPARTSPYDFFQYWVNTDDRDVEAFLGYFTFLPMEEIRQVRALQGAELNLAKTVLAFEATRITHGPEAAHAALEAAASVFGRREIPPDLLPSSTIPREAGETLADVPTTVLPRAAFEAGLPVLDLLVLSELVSSKSEARRLIRQGGAYLNNRRIEEVDARVPLEQVGRDGLLLRKGKKQYRRVRVA